MNQEIIPKVLDIPVEQDGFLNAIKTNLLLLEIAKEAGYTDINLTFIDAPPELAAVANGTRPIDQEIERQKAYIESHRMQKEQ